jgi:nitrogenase molybdenum-iron protein beta chain
VEYAELDRDLAEEYIREEEDRYYYYIKRHVKWLYTCKMPPKEFMINSSASVALSLTRFLVNDLGLLPLKVYIVDHVPELYEGRIRGYFNDLELENKDFEIVFTNDGGLMNAEVRNKAFVNPVNIFGTAWDELLAKNKKFPFVPVSAPYGDTVIGNKTYFGYDGAISLFTDFYADMANKSTGSV